MPLSRIGGIGGYGGRPEGAVRRVLTVDDRFGLDLGELSDAHADALARAALAQRYSYVFPDERSLTLLQDLGPIVEIGAGTGYWAYRLRAMGADVMAFDHSPPDGERANRYHAPTPTWTEVLPGDLTVLYDYTMRALFLCWPPLYSALGDALLFYSGDTVACIGDGGHRTARLRTLNETFSNISVVPVRALDPHPDAVPTLSIWRRTRLTAGLREG